MNDTHCLMHPHLYYPVRAPYSISKGTAGTAWDEHSSSEGATQSTFKGTGSSTSHELPTAPLIVLHAAPLVTHF